MDPQAEWPDYVKQVRAEAAQVRLKGARWKRRRVRGDGPLLVSVVKDEIDRLPMLLDHYRAAGIQQFVIIDNDSRDGSWAFLTAQPDVHAYRMERAYNGERKQGWIHRVITTYGRDRWYLCVDADEHIVFDGSSRHTLADLAALMDSRGIRRVRGMLVDMYARGPLLKFTLDADRPLHESFAWFDSDSHLEQKMPRMVSRKGGPRRRCMSTQAHPLNPELTKYPMFRLQPGEIMANPHHIYPYPPNFDSPCFLGILHFKFLPGLMERVHTAIREGNYWNDSAEYRAYRACLERDPDLALEYPGSLRYQSPDSLLDAGLIEPVPWASGRTASP